VPQGLLRWGRGAGAGGILGSSFFYTQLILFHSFDEVNLFRRKIHIEQRAATETLNCKMIKTTIS
jgi:hypothetical protein